MIKKEWSWMLNLPKKDNKVGLKSYMCNIDDKHDDDEQYLEDGVDDFISTNKPTPYNDDDYDY
jgi:hypothetical protein|tara:strand:+ start:11763 stop:11951 length:189 start_codon:yes stop_codon:yes gene_type:complete